MTTELKQQENYWDSQVDDFDSIYSRRKSRFTRFLDRVFRWDMFARYTYTLEKSEPIRDRLFLDIGCGTGLYSLEYARRECSLVVGIDIAENMVEVCSKRAEKEGLSERCEFVHADLLDYQPGKLFDVCIGIGLFDYISDPLPVIVKMRECVKDRVIMSFPKLWTWRAPIRKIRLGLKGCGVYFYSRKRIQDLLKEAGFVRHEMRVIGQLYCVTAYVE